MKRLIYSSQPFGFDSAMLSGILMSARRNNPRDDITGALICRQDIYLQLIEGPEDKLDALYSLIESDDRHTNVRQLLAEQTDTRMFPDWAMLDDEMPTLAWTPQQIAQGAIEAAKPHDLLAVFAEIAAAARQVRD